MKIYTIIPTINNGTEVSIEDVKSFTNYSDAEEFASTIEYADCEIAENELTNEPKEIPLQAKAYTEMAIVTNMEMTPIKKARYFKGDKTLKAYALDFIEENGPMTSTNIKKLMYEISNPGKTYDSYYHRGYYCSYFSKFGHALEKVPALFDVASPGDNRVLYKNNCNKYFVVREDSLTMKFGK